MATISDLRVEPMNEMTGRWIAAFANHATVGSGAAVWPLLAIIAGAAEGEARAELAAATGIDPDMGTRAGHAALDMLNDAAGVDAALGLWSRAELPIRPEWLAELPGGVHRELTGDVAADRAALDAWASQLTDGMIDRMPVTIDATTMVLLATALTVRTTWRERFSKPRQRRDGWPLMDRTTKDLSIVRATRSVTCVRVEGDNGIDVELVIGPLGALASDALSSGLAVVTGAEPAASGAELLDGAASPGTVVDHVVATENVPQCVIAAPRFTVRARHDLTTYPEVFGLATVRDASRQQLPGISDHPIAVDQAAQDAFAEFTDTGFRAAVVTAISMMRASMVRRTEEYEVRRVTVTFDRPFGFLAVHRDSGLVLVTGWVTAPDEG